ncbi:MAG: MBL fold metallo-hydrolase [Candidatus Binatia bacterium]|jgi:L-ascorbate metabolism protein UlaG (beta-lactamase superfamily)|nr:MBL fold metallo-hydrolase [Candidatus Binatia bacterium]
MVVPVRKAFIFLYFILLLNPYALRAACRDVNVASRFPALAHAAGTDAVIGYYGHNFFQIITKKGTRIITDPLGPGWYSDPNLSAHVVTVGREHFNHNYVEIVRGDPTVLRGLKGYGKDWNQVSLSFRDTFIYNVPIYQNGVEGSYLKGAAFMFDLGKLCIAHLGDLSHPLTPKQIKQMGKIDVALTPIGGRYTMGPETARKVIGQLKPRIAIPMHHRDNDYVVEEFARGFKVRQMDNHTLMVSKSSLPAPTEIVVLRPSGAMGYE